MDLCGNDLEVNHWNVYYISNKHVICWHFNDSLIYWYWPINKLNRNMYSGFQIWSSQNFFRSSGSLLKFFLESTSSVASFCSFEYEQIIAKIIAYAELFCKAAVVWISLAVFLCRIKYAPPAVFPFLTPERTEDQKMLKYLIE